MASYSLCFKPSVEKDLASLPQSIIVRIIDRLEGLKLEPLPPQAARLQSAEKLYRLRVGDYRIVYEVDPGSLQVIVHYVRHRREVYRRLR